MPISRYLQHRLQIRATAAVLIDRPVDEVSRPIASAVWVTCIVSTPKMARLSGGDLATECQIEMPRWGIAASPMMRAIRFTRRGNSRRLRHRSEQAHRRGALASDRRRSQLCAPIVINQANSEFW